ncbi:hypothetical protein DSO57_1028430 [Entomophthora muscae]|uniref:Uncharacterized protein n=1 Tax=Entomophthora muscae TaxID=34485 RepID=A0ACC2TNT7_9FUNG|nr:hypothetical protein DSO57_1028430 [Entomophthora muscae]
MKQSPRFDPRPPYWINRGKQYFTEIRYTGNLYMGILMRAPINHVCILIVRVGRQHQNGVADNKAAIEIECQV